MIEGCGATRIASRGPIKKPMELDAHHDYWKVARPCVYLIQMQVYEQETAEIRVRPASRAGPTDSLR